MTATTTPTAEPMFSTAQRALRFAYSFDYEQYPPTPLKALLWRNGGRGLHGMDGAVMAGTIKRIVDSLALSHRNMLICRYSIDDQAVFRALDSLSRIVSAAPLRSNSSSLKDNRRLISMMLRFFGRALHKDKKRFVVIDLCEGLSVSPSTFWRDYRPLRAYLKSLEKRALWEVEEKLIRAGIVL